MEKAFNIAGIQQVGIGVEDFGRSKKWYAKHFGMDLPVFEDEAEAKLMSNYTEGKVEKRKAALMMNLKGGGGFELWQFVNRKPRTAQVEIEEGQVGISAIHLRCSDLQLVYKKLEKLDDCILSEIRLDALSRKFFCLKGKFQNNFKIIEDDYCFLKTGHAVGGIMGVSIGVSNPKRSLEFYQNALGFSELLAEEEINGKRHWWLKQKEVKKSAFGDLLGAVVIELIHDPKHANTKIFQNRCWGDLGYIHLCLDVQNMSRLKSSLQEQGHKFVVDSENGYDMGDAAGRFAYIEDPDGTLIELVETYKVPIMKKWGWFIKLNEKSKFKALPKWIFRILALNRVKS
jgi:catechol 2,3-dioxygenase-like lactoylglutathione lyase family enzyme